MKKLLITAILLAIPFTTFAAEITPEAITTFYWRVAMFIVFVVLLVYFTRKPVVKMLTKRTETILAELNEAEEAKKAAQAQVEEYKAKMIQLEKELEEMKVNARKMVELERDSMIADAHRQVEQMKSFAKHMIESETIKAKSELHDEVITLAAQEVEKMFKKEISEGKADTLLNFYIKRIGE